MNKLIVTTVVSAGVAVVSLGMSAYSAYKQQKMVKKMWKVLGDIEEMGEDKISEALIRKAVEQSANRKVDAYMKDTEDQVLRMAHRDLEIQARNAVEKYSADIRKKAADEVARQVASLDIEKLKSRVCDQAEKHVLEKLDDCTDKYARKFEEQLENQKKIYDRIAQAAVEKERKGDEAFRVVVL